MASTQRRRLGLAAVCVSAIAFGGCSSSPRAASSPDAKSTADAVASSSVAEPAKTSASSVAAPGPDESAYPRSPKASAEEVVLALLEAEKAGNHRASFALLTRAGLAKYRSPDVWATHRIGVARVTGYHRETVKGGDVTALVEHKPAIDPFVGLQFAQEHQTWHARQEPDGWLVEPEPDIEPIVPADAGARDVAAKWAAARQSCDQAAELELQAVRTPFGESVGAAALCRSSGALSTGEPTQGSPGPQTAQLVAQYGPAVIRYVRGVEISGGPEPFTVLLVPIGDAWRVIAASD